MKTHVLAYHSCAGALSPHCCGFTELHLHEISDQFCVTAVWVSVEGAISLNSITDSTTLLCLVSLVWVFFFLWAQNYVMLSKKTVKHFPIKIHKEESKCLPRDSVFWCCNACSSQQHVSITPKRTLPCIQEDLYNELQPVTYCYEQQIQKRW